MSAPGVRKELSLPPAPRADTRVVVSGYCARRPTGDARERVLRLQGIHWCCLRGKKTPGSASCGLRQKKNRLGEVDRPHRRIRLTSRPVDGEVCRRSGAVCRTPSTLETIDEGTNYRAGRPPHNPKNRKHPHFSLSEPTDRPIRAPGGEMRAHRELIEEALLDRAPGHDYNRLVKLRRVALVQLGCRVPGGQVGRSPDLVVPQDRLSPTRKSRLSPRRGWVSQKNCEESIGREDAAGCPEGLSSRCERCRFRSGNDPLVDRGVVMSGSRPATCELVHRQTRDPDQARRRIAIGGEPLRKERAGSWRHHLLCPAER